MWPQKGSPRDQGVNGSVLYLDCFNANILVVTLRLWFFIGENWIKDTRNLFVLFLTTLCESAIVLK